MGFLGFQLTAAMGALAVWLAVSVTASIDQAEPAAFSQDATTLQGQDALTWRTDLAAAMDEARRTKRPLLAVFR